MCPPNVCACSAWQEAANAIDYGRLCSAATRPLLCPSRSRSLSTFSVAVKRLLCYCSLWPCVLVAGHVWCEADRVFGKSPSVQPSGVRKDIPMRAEWVPCGFESVISIIFDNRNLKCVHYLRWKIDEQRHIGADEIYNTRKKHKPTQIQCISHKANNNNTMIARTVYTYKPIVLWYRSHWSTHTSSCHDF